MLDQRRLQELLRDLVKRDAGGHLRAAYFCVKHAQAILISCGFVPEARSLNALNAVEKYLYTDLGEDACFDAAYASRDDVYIWQQATPSERVTISFNRAASTLARAVLDYDFYEPDRHNILMAINHARLAANQAMGGTFVGPEDEWQEQFLASCPGPERSRLRVSLLAS